MKAKPLLNWRKVEREDGHHYFSASVGAYNLCVYSTKRFCDQGWDGFYYMAKVNGEKATEWGTGYEETWDKELAMVLAERQALFLASQIVAALCLQKGEGEAA